MSSYNNKLIDDLLMASAFIPRSLKSPKSWVGHIPFATWLIREVTPRLLVELGTHTGNSYFTFCQAVTEAQLSTQCYAVDTWLGDDQAGYYGDDVFQQVANHNQEYYAGFSSLLRMTFDAAVNKFAEGSIDLLHIDGRHTYQDVKHDFESWLPRLAPGAIVLFHDIMVRDRDFGVWKLWQELKERYPLHLEFSHSNGLGVLQLSAEGDERPAAFMSLETSQRQQLINYFSSLGARCVERHDLEELQNRFAERGQYVDELNKVVESGAEHIAELKREVKDGAEHISELKQEVKDGAEHIAELKQELEDNSTQFSELHSKLQTQNAALEKSTHAHHAAEQRYQDIIGSTVWKSTYPVRRLLQRHPRARQLIRRSLKLVWWLLTGQLARRLRMRHSSAGLTTSATKVSVTAATELPSEPASSTAEGVVTSAEIPPEVARPIDIDYSVAVPFAYQRELVSSPTLAVFCHLFYEEQVHEFRRYLANIPFSFDLYISTDDKLKKTIIEKAFSGWSCGRIEVRVMQNCGRDIAPKLVGFKDVYADYEYVLHLHSKRSEHDSVLEHWRGFLLENLLGSEAVVRSIFDAFEQHSDLGMVAGQHFEPVRHWINWGGNFPAAHKLAQSMGIHLKQEQVLDFPSGSMFWARSAALKPLLDVGLSLVDFTEEDGQIDGTLAHAIERLYYHVCEAAGYKWLKISDPELFAQTPAIVTINSIDALDRYIVEHNLQLTGEDLPAPRVRHPQPIEQPAPELIKRRQADALGFGAAIPASTRVAIGIVTYNNRSSVIHGLVDSAFIALDRAGLRKTGTVFVIDNGAVTAGDWSHDESICYLPSDGNVGFGAGHNRLMAEAFQHGAEMYIAANPDGLFHPDAVAALVRMMRAHQGRALIEALQFPEEHPKPFDPVTFATPWASGACLAIPVSCYVELGGFDPDFFMYCEDVDLSWRARANGFAVCTCPQALFLHDVEDRSRDEKVRKMIFTSGSILARKWGADDFAAWLDGELELLGGTAPDGHFSPVPEAWRRFANFKHQLRFAEARWIPYV